MKDHTITGIKGSSQDNSAVTLGDAKSLFLPRDGSRQMSGTLNMGGNSLMNIRPFVEDDNINQSGQAIDFSFFHAQRGELKRLINSASAENLPLNGRDSMTGNLNMGNNKITNLHTDADDAFSAANVRHVSQANAYLITTLTDSFKKKINEAHISSSTDRDVFRYIMEDVDESASESNIIVDGIIDFPSSPHDVNKKVYSFRMGKGASNVYSSRLSFNMYKLPQGEFTLVIEFFPPFVEEVTVSVVSASLNIGQQSTKRFPEYTRSIVHLHKWDVTPPERIYVDMRCRGVAQSPAQGRGYLIVYGVKGRQNDVSSDVYDSVYSTARNYGTICRDFASVESRF